MWWWDRLIEDRINEARDAGHFDSLRGEGKPLRLDDGNQAGENWLAFHLMKEAGVLPDWLELRKEIAEERKAVRQVLGEIETRLAWLPLRSWAGDPILRRATQRYERLARDLNLKIEQHNHRCPSIRQELVKVREDAVQRAMSKRGFRGCLCHTSSEPARPERAGQKHGARTRQRGAERSPQT
jgi:hypothetical protein